MKILLASLLLATMSISTACAQSLRDAYKDDQSRKQVCDQRFEDVFLTPDFEDAWFYFCLNRDGSVVRHYYKTGNRIGYLKPSIEYYKRDEPTVAKDSSYAYQIEVEGEYLVIYELDRGSSSPRRQVLAKRCATTTPLESRCFPVRKKVLESKEKFNNYFDSGNAKKKSKNYQGAIADYSKAIAIDPHNAVPFGIRAEAKYLLGDQQGACPDLKKAVSLGSQVATQWLNSEKGELCRNMK